VFIFVTLRGRIDERRYATIIGVAYNTDPALKRRAKFKGRYATRPPGTKVLNNFGDSLS
jgi:hypothetical protein